MRHHIEVLDMEVTLTLQKEEEIDRVVVVATLIGQTC
jgi:hypothetical protein